ncbi:hypothetical protein RB593_005594 [Gaeumannomyces tritici]
MYRNVSNATNIGLRFERLERLLICPPAKTQSRQCWILPKSMESFLAKDKSNGHIIKTFAKDIYSSDARFVFELLQNADDSRFQRARVRGDLPSIAFHVHPGRIVVECNEDGFTKRDLSAICTVGQSTKSGSHGYIGAKGIGFKSVFSAAWKVYI